MKKKFTVYGNCQSTVLADCLQRVKSFKNIYQYYRIPFCHRMTSNEYKTLAAELNNIDLLITQPVSTQFRGGGFDSNYLSRLAKYSMGFPSLQFYGYFPSLSRFTFPKMSLMPKKNSVLVETFLRSNINHIVIYSFEGKKVNQTLGILFLRQLDKLKAQPLSFVATDYAIAIKTLKKVPNISSLFSKKILFNNFYSWINSTTLVKRHFRNIAIVSGLIEKKHPGHIKSNKQVTFNSDLIYEVLLKFEKNHILLHATKLEVLNELINYKRLECFFAKAEKKILFKNLKKLSPFSATLLLEFDSVNINNEKVLSYALETASTNILKEANLIK